MSSLFPVVRSSQFPFSPEGLYVIYLSYVHIQCQEHTLRAHSTMGKLPRATGECGAGEPTETKSVVDLKICVRSVACKVVAASEDIKGEAPTLRVCLGLGFWGSEASVAPISHSVRC